MEYSPYCLLFNWGHIVGCGFFVSNKGHIEVVAGEIRRPRGIFLRARRPFRGRRGRRRERTERVAEGLQSLGRVDQPGF